MFSAANKEKVRQQSWNKLDMAEHQEKFPIEELKTNLKNIQSSLEQNVSSARTSSVLTRQHTVQSC
jgi:hypothetical protein